jgi:hypothetical protein
MVGAGQSIEAVTTGAALVPLKMLHVRSSPIAAFAMGADLAVTFRAA